MHIVRVLVCSKVGGLVLDKKGALAHPSLYLAR